MDSGRQEGDERSREGRVAGGGGKDRKAGGAGGGQSREDSEGKDKGKERKTAATEPFSPPPGPKVKNRLCGERETEWEQAAEARRWEPRWEGGPAGRSQDEVAAACLPPKS